jgi:hypothetical protein
MRVGKQCAQVVAIRSRSESARCKNLVHGSGALCWRHDGRVQPKPEFDRMVRIPEGPVRRSTIEEAAWHTWRNQG